MDFDFDYDKTYGTYRERSPHLSTDPPRIYFCFYIDHVNKVTSWEDPRFKKPTQHQAAQALSPGGASHHAHHRGQGHQGEAIAMRDMQRQGHAGHTQQQDTGFSRVDNVLAQKIKALLPTCPESVIKQTLLKNQNNYGLAFHELEAKGYSKEQPVMQLSDTPATRLKEFFPAATTGVIQDVLAMCGNNEEEAKDQLIDLGFQMTRSSGSTSRTVSPSHSPRHHESSGLSPHHSHSGQRRHSGNHSRQAAAQPAKPHVSEAEKERMKSKLQSEFPTVSKDIILMALEATSYNETSAKRVLGGTYSRGSSSSTRVSSAGSSTTTSSSHESRTSSAGHHAPARHTTNAGLEPVAFPDDRPESRPSSTHASSSRETTPSRSQGPSHHRHGTTPGQQQQKAKQVTRMSEQLLNNTNDMLNHLASSCCMREGEEIASASDQSEASSDSRQKARAKVTTTAAHARPVVTAQPQTYTSAYRTLANGPNPALRNGPDRNLLLADYTVAHGPNPALRSGPDPSRVQGSQGAQGPDPSLRCGPQSNLHHGPSIENLSAGPDLSARLGPVLVSAI